MIAQASSRKPAENLLVLDIGNSATTVGVWSAGDIRASTSVPDNDSESLTAAIQEHWKALQEKKETLACSVVPECLANAKKIVAGITGKDLLVVGEDLPLPIEVKIEKPDSVGVDRLCNAAAGFMIEGQACVTVDLGSAITVDCVDHQGCFIGGAILPGLKMQAKALASQTALLPEVTIECPERPLGQHTEHAIRSGIVFGSIGAIKELVERYASILKGWPVLIMTGGDAAIVAEATEIVDQVVPHLCLRGVVLAYQKMFENES